ncbi:hypothetical protein FRB93_011228 [Tulasnella sp. JGI-2019a]|nr:hypothetical protein FRB93_011228 [Tulasnella sp. JGI-2019a]
MAYRNKIFERVPRILDQMALLLVTERSGDVATVTVSITSTDLHLMVMTVAKNPNPDTQSKEPYVTECTTGRTPDWLQDRLVTGPFDLKTHTGYLACLIGKLHNAPGDKIAETRELSRFIYCQCLPKITRRAKAEIVPKISAIHFFESFHPPDITFSNDPFPPPKDAKQLEDRGRLVVRDESRLINVLSTYSETSFSYSDDHVGGVPVRHLILDKQSKTLLATWIKSTVKRLIKQVDETNSVIVGSKVNMEAPDAQRKDTIVGCLDRLAKTMNDINALVHGSVSVWDLLHSTEMMGFYKTFLAQSSASARDFPVTPDEVSMEQDEEEDNLPEVEPGPPLVSELRLDEVFGAVSSRAQKPKEPSQNISGSAIPHQGR